MNKLHDVFEGREIFLKQLNCCQEIKLNISKLIIVLERLKPMESESINICLKDDSSKWETLST
jgi:hypothetical protein